MYKVTNKLNQRIKCRDIIFEAHETKELDFKPYSDKFIIENVEKKEKPTKLKEVKK